MSKTKYALISVYDKANVTSVAETLLNQGYKIISTGGTYKVLKQAFPEIQKVSDFTGAPEILGGRVKTLHPRVYGGILSRRTGADCADYTDVLIDVIIVNLYPFQKEQTIEMIDIGGVSLLRAAAKNFLHVVTICDPADYNILEQRKISELDKFNLAKKAFRHVADYDKAISNWFAKETELKYGLNPHQKSAWMIQPVAEAKSPLKMLNGTPGYINMLDALGAWQLVTEACEALDGTTVVASFKHTSPAGVGTGRQISCHERKMWMIPFEDELSEAACAYIRARNGDPLSSYGDFVACSHIVDVSMAKQLRREVSDGIIAPAYTPGALEILEKKKNGKFIILEMDTSYVVPEDFKESRQIFGFELVQERNNAKITADMFSKYNTSLEETRNLILGNITLKYTQSNSVVFVYEGQVIGVGAGQQNRLDCVKIAAKKASIWFMRQSSLAALSALEQGVVSQMRRQDIINAVYRAVEPTSMQEPYLLQEPGIVLCSDAFFPFRDSIDHLNKRFCSGISIICHPGGSIADQSIREACEESKRRMIVTGVRLFTH